MSVSIHTSHKQVPDTVALPPIPDFDLGHPSPMALGLNEDFSLGGAHGEFWVRFCRAMRARGCVSSLEHRPPLLERHIARTPASEAHRTCSPPEVEKLEGHLTRVGIPASNVPQYGIELTNHRLLLFVEGDLETVDRAHRALEATKSTNHTLHHGVSD